MLTSAVVLAELAALAVCEEEWTGASYDLFANSSDPGRANLQVDNHPVL
jgi:hypothetical protein